MTAWERYVNDKFKKQRKRFEVIEQLHEDNLIDGKTNQEVYQLYLDRCDDDDYTIIGVSKMITKYFGYVLHDKKIDGKKQRVFAVQGSRWGQGTRRNLEP